MVTYIMKTMSISLQEGLYERLKHSVPSKKISKFVSHAISAELERKDRTCFGIRRS